MPKKGHRAASRQAQLRQRQRRTRGQPQEFDPGPTESSATVIDEEPAVEPELEEEVPIAAPRPVRRSRRRTAPEPVQVYGQLGAELRLIGILTAFVGVILAVLTVLLRT